MKYLKLTVIIIATLAALTFIYMKTTGTNLNDIGLAALSTVKKIKGEQVDLTRFEKEDAPEISHQLWSDILKVAVDTKGQFDYQAVHQDPTKLEEYLALLSNNPPAKNWSKQDKLAYWINAYNAFTVKLIVDHYPIKSIKEISDGLPMISSPWDIKYFKIGGKDFDLNTIEHQILRKYFDEPRIHFAINCASASCPVIHNEAYQSSILDEQLDQQTKAFLLDPSKNQIGYQKAQLSSILNWFASDFNGHGGVVKFVDQYVIAIDEITEISYLDYDWSLNGK